MRALRRIVPRQLFPRVAARRQEGRSASDLAWASLDPLVLSPANEAQNLVSGAWSTTQERRTLVDPLTGDAMLTLPATSSDEAKAFARNLGSVPKTGLHNPLKAVHRYGHLGRVHAAMATELRKPAVEDFFTRLIQRVVPKHDAQARGEVTVVRTWLESFSGDSVRQLARSFGVPGDRPGQASQGYRFPFGGVAVITPFNFPLEIPAIQTLSALMMGNRPLLKVDEKVAIVMEQFLRLAVDCGLPPGDVDFLYSDGRVANEVLKQGDPRTTLFTGSQAVAEQLVADLKGKVRLEDAGFDWKILGPDVCPKHLDFVAWQCDQDAYAFSGQKCSAQSVLFAHENWVRAGLLERLGELAARRSLADLTCSPVLTWSNEDIQAHLDATLRIAGAQLLFGGKALAHHRVPLCYGAWEPTAVQVPLAEAVTDAAFPVWTRELFGPFQIVIPYGDDDLGAVLHCCERMTNHLTAAVVSNDVHFVNHVLANTVNGTTYAGYLARTTGAPQNHWFGPAGDPRAGGIHTKEAIQAVWSCHREILHDVGPLDASWATPAAT